MPENVKRPYDASRRQARARETRRAVVEAARDLIEHRGYAGTTVADVAAAAGVSPESVYKGFGSKPALVKAVLDVALAGDDEAVPVADRPGARAVRAEPDVREKLRLYAHDAVIRGERSALVQLAIRNGASADPVLADLWRSVQAERLAGMSALAAHLLETGQLRAGVGLEHARDVLWTAISVEVYDLLVLQRGWTLDAYADWLTRTLVAALT